MDRREFLSELATAGLTLSLAGTHLRAQAPGSTKQPHADFFTNVPTELSFQSTRSYQDIFDEIDVDVRFEGPDGRAWKVPAFWAGDGDFRVRFAAPLPGHYTYRSICTNREDPGLHGQRGHFEARPHDGTNDLLRRGRLRVAASRRTLEHVDGTPFFWLGDTWWFGLVKRLDWPLGFGRLTADRVAKGFSVIQIVAGPLPDYDAVVNPFDRQQANEAGLSWHEGWTRINPAFYDLADLRIAHLVESALVPCIVGMWGYFLPRMGVRRVKKHWRNLVARYGAWPVIWCTAGEVKMPSYSLMGTAQGEAEIQLQEEGWTEVTRYVRQIDPFHNPITAHPSFPDSRSMLRDDSVLDVNLLQTGHSGYASLKSSVETLRDCLAKKPPMPTLNSEVCYEGIMGGSRDEVQRFLFWASVTEGACGHTYGAQGIWAMNSAHQEHRGFTGSWGGGYWTDAMHYPGSRHVGVGRKLLERYPWWLLQTREVPAAQEKGRISSFACAIPGALAIFYLPASCIGGELAGMSIPDWKGQVMPIPIEAGATYQAYYFNPRTGEALRSYVARGLKKITLGDVTPDNTGTWTPPPKPTMEDWLLVLENKKELAKLGARRSGC